VGQSKTNNERIVSKQLISKLLKEKIILKIKNKKRIKRFYLGGTPDRSPSSASWRHRHPQFSARVAYNATALADIKNAYTAGQAFFGDNPAGVATVADLYTSGYNPSKDVTVTIADGHQQTFALTSAHATGDKTYAIDAQGKLTP
jgi:hypothetical protein